MRCTTRFLGLVVPALLSAFAVQADPGQSGPALGVARVSVVRGDIATRRGDSGDWIAATANMPVVEGDAIQSTGNSRAEVQMDRGNFVRIGEDSEVLLRELASKRFRVQVVHGAALYSELERSEADVDIETPLAAVRPMEAGRYKVTVSPTETLIEVRKGKAEIAFQNSTTTLAKGQAMTVRPGASGEAAFEIGRASSADQLDKWAADRDRTVQRAASYQYVSRDIYGAGDLDRHGIWRFVASLGYCWFPRVAASWVPYRQGRWIWLDYYGWTWVGSEPWGWAPYHWGRWQRHKTHGWGWYPGTPWLRHVWRPALVSFVGFHPVVRPPVWSGFAGIGWVPLAPGERYFPWYGRGYYGGSSATTIVVDNRVQFFNSYRNARNRRAVSYINSRQFPHGSRHAPRGLRAGEGRTGSAIRGPLPVVPARSSQGLLLRASTSTRSSFGAPALRTGNSSRLRDGSARIPFADQRSRMRQSVEAFYRGYRAAGDSATPSPARLYGARTNPGTPGTGVASIRVPAPIPAPAPLPLPGEPSGVRSAAASTAAPGPTIPVTAPHPLTVPRSGSSLRAPLPAPAIPSIGSGARSSTSAVGISRSNGVYRPSTSVRTGTSPSPYGTRSGSAAGVSNRVGALNQARTPSPTPTLPSIPRTTRTPTAGWPSAGSTARRPPPVYAPRSSSRIGSSTPRRTGSRPTAASSNTGVLGGSVYRSPTSPQVGAATPSTRSARTLSPATSTGSSSIWTAPAAQTPSTGVYVPRTRSRTSPVQSPGVSASSSGSSRARVPSPTIRTPAPTYRTSTGTSRGSRSRTATSPSPRFPSTGTRSRSGLGTFGGIGSSRSPTATGGGIRSAPSSRPSSSSPRIGGLSTSRGSRIGSGSSPSASRPSYGRTAGSSSRPSSVYRSGSSIGRGSRPSTTSSRSGSRR